MAKQFLLAASCLLALSVGTLLVSAAHKEHKHHPKKHAGHLSADGQSLYKEAIEFVHSAEDFLQSFAEVKARHVELAVMVKEHKDLEEVIKQLKKNATKTKKVKKPRKAPKSGEVRIAQMEEEFDEEEIDEEDGEHMHTFSASGHQLKHKTLQHLETTAKNVLKEAEKLAPKKTLTQVEQDDYHTKLNHLISAMVEVERELEIKDSLEGEEGKMFNYPGVDQVE